jgi:hypothetical protein
LQDLLLSFFPTYCTIKYYIVTPSGSLEWHLAAVAVGGCDTLDLAAIGIRGLTAKHKACEICGASLNAEKNQCVPQGFNSIFSLNVIIEFDPREKEAQFVLGVAPFESGAAN